MWIITNYYYKMIAKVVDLYIIIPLSLAKLKSGAVCKLKSLTDASKHDSTLIKAILVFFKHDPRNEINLNYIASNLCHTGLPYIQAYILYNTFRWFYHMCRYLNNVHYICIYNPVQKCLFDILKKYINSWCKVNFTFSLDTFIV